MTRKLATLLLAAALGLGHGTAHAVGLGEIAVESALDQPFEARIQVRNVGSLETNEVIVNLASTEDFERIGVERFFFLSGLRFDTDFSDPDRPVVKVTSESSITEPFLNFVVELIWPSGRLLREYTVLLDPPTYGARTGEAAQMPSVVDGGSADGPAARPERRPADRTAPGTRSTTAVANGKGRLQGDEYGATGRNDTLWEIASKVRPGDVSVQQTMLALLRTNPEAFIGGNINQLKAGQVLRIPDADEIERLSFRDAVVQVAEHNERWRQGLDREPLDARDREVAAGSGSTMSSGELRLVAAESGSQEASGAATGSSGGSVDPAQLREVRSRLESVETTNEDLESRLEESRSRIDEVERELELKSEQLARAQQALKAQMESAPSAPPSQASPDRAAGGLFGASWSMIAAAVIGLAVLGGAALMLSRRRGSEVHAEANTGVEAEVERTQLMPAISGEELGDTAGENGSDSSHGGGQDAIDEADVYMVYGRFSEAARVLSNALESDPRRSDIRLKLLEVYAESGDTEGFNEQIRELAEVADTPTIEAADRLAERLPGAVTSAGESAEGDRPSTSARETAAGDMSMDFDLAEDGDAKEAPTEDAHADLYSMDIELEPEAAAVPDSGDDPDFDLDLDGDDDGGEAGDARLPDEDPAGLNTDGNEPAAPAEDEAGEKAEDDGGLPTLDFAGDLDIDDDTGEREPEFSGAAKGEADPGPELDFDPSGEEDDDSDKAGNVGRDDVASARLMHSDAVKPALPESDTDEKEPASGGGETRGDGGTDDDLDDFEFDIDELADMKEDPLAAGPVEPPGRDSAVGKPPADDESADLDDFEFEIDELADTKKDPLAADPVEPPERDSAVVEAPADDESSDLEDFEFEIDASADASSSSEDQDEVEDDSSLNLADLEADSDGDALLGLDGDSTPDSAAETVEDRPLSGSNRNELDPADEDFDFEFDFASDDDAGEIATRLELARAYVDMGDDDGAREILAEVVRDGDDGQKRDAEELLSKLS